jgi:hypothetical protein
MISDKELWACAHAVMEFHGEAVGEHFLGRMRAMRGAKDLDGLGTWLAIEDRVRELSNGLGAGRALH